MSKISTIIVREYLSRIKKKAFLIITFLTPFLFILLFLVPIWLLSQKEENKHFAVIDKSAQFAGVFTDTEEQSFTYETTGDTSEIKSLFSSAEYDAVIFIPHAYLSDSIYIYSEKSLPLSTKQVLGYKINENAQRQVLLSMHIDPDVIKESRKNIPIKTYQWDDKGNLEQNSSELDTAFGFIGAFIIYMFIFMYGAQLMRGTYEEKKDRIVEIIISSVKPFELMLGKIIGVALVAFTQFGIWLLTILGVLMFGKSYILQAAVDTQITAIIGALQNFDSFVWIFYFLFFFIGGYLLYGSMFAAIGAAVDNETDTQQFMLPVTIPLILAIVFAQSIIEAPNGDLAVIMSMIPFTSPIVMMVRIGFGVPIWQMLLSGGLLIATFLFTTYIGAKIYRIGILSYGKKVSYRDLWKWIRYK